MAVTDPKPLLRSLARRAMLARGLEPDFPAAVRGEIEALPATPELLSGATDLRALPWCSIDNDDSRDLDQLSVAQPGPDGTTRILIAIADVQAPGRPGS